MSVFKKIFGKKNKENKKFGSNTLAETNGSVDLRLSPQKEKLIDAETLRAKSNKKASKSTDEKDQSVNTSALVNDDTDNYIYEDDSRLKVVNLTAADIMAAKSGTKSAKASIVQDINSSSATKKASAVKKSNSGADKKATEGTPKKPAQKNTPPASDKKSESAAVQKTADTKVSKTVAANNTEDTKRASAKSTKANSDNATKKSTSEKTTSSATVAKKADTAKSESKTTTKNISLKTSSKSSEQTEEVTVSKATRTGKFEIKKSKDGRFVFNLYASNNVIVATSQIYSSSTSAMNGIKSVIANASTSPVEDQTLKNYTVVPYPKWEIYRDKGEQYRFRLCASNGSCVCHSQGYTSKTNCKKGIESIIKFASDAEITKAYLEKKDK